MRLIKTLLRDIAAILVCAIFMAPILWWALTSVMPGSVALDVARQVRLDFTPTFGNYLFTLFSPDAGAYGSRRSLADSMIVASLSTLIALAAALPAAHGLSRSRFRGRWAVMAIFLAPRLMLPVMLIAPLFFAYHSWGLIDSHLGLAAAHTALTLPLAIFLLKSFLDDVPPEVADAAALDGASPVQAFLRITLPMIRGGVATTAILCFIFSWTEFVVSLFLTQQMRLVPVQAQILVMGDWGPLAALTTAALIPVFVFVLLVQRHLVRGLTFGLVR